jgi:hypothetical protein
MPLPPHLRKYDSLIDLLAEAIVRQIEEENEAARPGTNRSGRGSMPTTDEVNQHGNSTARSSEVHPQAPR